MPRPAYTGAWRNNALFTNEALPLAPGVDPSHMQTDRANYGARAPGGSPDRLDFPPQYVTEDTDASYALALDQSGIDLENEPLTHDAPNVRAIPSPVHMREGLALRNTYQPPTLRASDETRITPRWELDPTQGDLTVASLRGDNSLPENNPDGFRLGYSIKRFVNRRAFPGGLGDGWRTHTERFLRPGGAAAATESPAPKNPNRYESPFSWNVKALGTRLQMPVLRRDPPSFSEVVTDDGSADFQTADLDFVIG